MSFLREFLIKLLLWREVKVMAVVYATLIVKGKKDSGAGPRSHP